MDFSIGTLAEREKETKYESDSLAVGTYTGSDGKEYDAFGTVKATVHTYEKELPVKALMELTITNNQSRETIVSQKFQAEYIWKNRWATFNGDERAVPDELLSLSKRKQQMPPPPQDMFLLVSDPIYNDASQFLRSYYKRK